ncbi:Methionyl-tRNA formyltransferase [Thalassoporum mexicanum PCC 7367]|uniref:methionyl-tRNA formyltransferase n=1 Tax=Thalassoporum mexicanum TaxID=3457544 RepID=UPI00029F921E|nr:methionyl-tRNA formyltransferase [Pseudanabaena sp. PCC 7367]AFY70965.1 Methionyl-tRNA formyltransferase [Pseudanabaena sp. PCC 7367]
MRVVFFGTPDFAVPTLQHLLNAADFEVLGVVTQPDARRGRGKKMTPSPVKQVAIEHALKVWQPNRLKRDQATLAELEALQADVFVVVAYGQILSQQILDMPKYGCINVHGSLLPKYRGCAPVQWAIANGEQVTGITTMQMDKGIDTGDMLLIADLAIEAADNAETLSPKLAELGANLLIDTLQQIETIKPQPQDHSQNSYAPMIGKEDWQIDWQSAAIEIHNKVRGFYPNCFTDYQGQRLKILETQLLKPAELNEQAKVEIGAIAQLVKKSGFAIQTSTEPLLITKLQPAGKRPQSGWDFANGARLEVGQLLFPPA